MYSGGEYDMNSQKIGKLVVVIITLLVLTFLGALYFSSRNPDISFIGVVSGLSSFFVAILTALYVYTTSKQIEVATAQLEEMKQERAMQEQPLLILRDDQFEIERPRFFYTPPEDEYSFQSRYNFSAKVYNCSNYPAVSTDVSAEIQVEKDGTVRTLKTVTRRLNVVGPNDEVQFAVSFAGDEMTNLFEALRGSQAKALPKIKTTITYKNLCGGFFKSEQIDYIAPRNTDSETLILWHSRIHGAYIEKKDQIAKLKKISKDEKWDKIFEAVENSFDSSLGDKESIIAKCIEIPQASSLSSITRQQFDDETQSHRFSHYIHRASNCIEESKNEHK